jgi:tetratricopeptide (TPR) repeat protein
MLGTDTGAVADAVSRFVDAGEPCAALEIVGRAWRIWSSSGKLEEGSAAAAVALGAAADGNCRAWRARALYGAGVIAFRAGDDVASRALNGELLELARVSVDVRGECDAMTGLARLALRRGDYEEVVSLARQARDKARLAGEAEAEAAPLHLEAAGVRLQQHYEDARRLYAESLELNERIGSAAFVAMERHNLGWVSLHLGDVEAAEAFFRERDAQSPPDGYGDAWKDLNWAAVAAIRGEPEEARNRFNTGLQALDALGVALDPDDKFELDWLRGLVGPPAR